MTHPLHLARPKICILRGRLVFGGFRHRILLAPRHMLPYVPPPLEDLPWGVGHQVLILTLTYINPLEFFLSRLNHLLNIYQSR